MPDDFRSFATLLADERVGHKGPLVSGRAGFRALDPNLPAAGAKKSPSGSVRALRAPESDPGRHGAQNSATAPTAERPAPPAPAPAASETPPAASNQPMVLASSSHAPEHPAPTSVRSEPPTPPPIMPREPAAPPAARGASPQVVAVLTSFAAEIVRLRARAAELVENEAESLIQMIASRVLVRELELAPADVTALVGQVRREWERSVGMRFRVAASDIETLRPLGQRLESDPALQPGDLQVEFADGLLDLRLGTRLAAVLEEHKIAV